MKVKSAMHRGVEWCAPDTPVRELAELMKSKDIGAVPIGENDRLVGMVTDRDIVCNGVATGQPLGKLTARDVMTSGIIFCREDEDISDAVQRMEEKQIRRLPVIDENKRMVGILSLGDVSHSASAKLTGAMAKAVSAHH